MPVLQFKSKSVIETHHDTVPHHSLEFDRKLSVLGADTRRWGRTQVDRVCVATASLEAKS